ncbi:hypothetical protein B0J11DRAFT_571547 [Dendryphion nanum]|uniref:Uncharacterized protein n=1 Tax=Dendryphion nanum TaxID=256645 RepID=A0A9P9DD11_9PLEO|nr:hypothetical protein B0J11DRAFT_571547 [Dendryphion nanum]
MTNPLQDPRDSRLSSPRSSLSSAGRLPGDEHRRLQGRNRIASLFASPRSSGTVLGGLNAPGGTISPRHPSTNPKPQATDQRLLTSQIRYESRRALGPSFDFTDEWHDALNDNPPRTRRSDATREFRKSPALPYLSRSNPANYSGNSGSWISRESLPETLVHPHYGGPDPFGGYGSPATNEAEVTNMFRQMDAYHNTYGQGKPDVLGYRDGRNGRPEPVMTEAMKPIQSSFDWDSDSDGDADESGEKIHGNEHAKHGELQKSKSKSDKHAGRDKSKAEKTSRRRFWRQ